jgi:dTDP-4-amino-4,6-dideoxygalactose transaminase
MVAAFLLAQLEELNGINQQRLALWHRYHAALEPLERAERIKRMTIPAGAGHNGHIYFFLLADSFERSRVLDALRARGVNATFHFVPLHATPAGKRYGRAAGSLATTEMSARQIVRLPMHLSLTPGDQDRVLDAVFAELSAS